MWGVVLKGIGALLLNLFTMEVNKCKRKTVKTNSLNNNFIQSLI